MSDKMPHDKLGLMERLFEYGVFGYVWLIIISIWGGTVRYIIEVRKGERPSFMSWVYEACVSGFVGVITAMVCQYYALDFLITSAITGVAAHNGTRTLYVLTEVIKKRINKELG